MSNHHALVPRVRNGEGWFGTSVNWLTSRGRLLVPGFAPQQVQQRVLECFEALDLGLAVWDEHGQQLMSNKANARLQDRVESSSELAQQGNPQGPYMRLLSGNRWVLTFQATSTAGYRSTARVDVTNLVRRVKELEDRVRSLALESATDALTGLANRRQFDAVLLAEWNRAARTQSPLSLLMVDIDHFKKYNDRYGHLTGDQCLRRVAATLLLCARRAGDFVARFGGEEFVLLLPGADLDEARDTAQQCLDRMREVALPHAASPVAAFVTLSIGVASRTPEATEGVVSLINAADAAMYRAKSDGRARYEAASQLDWDIDDETPRTQPAVL
ncbi:MAG: GGDEF domain-containing protein [Rhodoferax sp.]|nr:GGDEF domain-containing protein [Rhodoferax sp.]